MINNKTRVIANIIKRIMKNILSERESKNQLGYDIQYKPTNLHFINLRE